MVTTTLQLNRLDSRHHGVTRSIANVYAEAASVCFDRHHSPPADVTIDGLNHRVSYSTVWTKPTPRELAAWANSNDATEQAAYGVSLASIETTEGLVAISRAETLTGADYYIAPIGSEVNDLEGCFKLEVSGVDAGSMTDIRARVMRKKQQANSGTGNLPAIAAVVGFKELIVVLERA